MVTGRRTLSRVRRRGSAGAAVAAALGKACLRARMFHPGRPSAAGAAEAAGAVVLEAMDKACSPELASRPRRSASPAWLCKLRVSWSQPRQEAQTFSCFVSLQTFRRANERRRGNAPSAAGAWNLAPLDFASLERVD